MGDDFFVVIRAFFARPEKAPTKMNRLTFISLQDVTKYISLVKEKLYDKFFVIDLKGFSSW